MFRLEGKQKYNDNEQIDRQTHDYRTRLIQATPKVNE